MKTAKEIIKEILGEVCIGVLEPTDMTITDYENLLEKAITAYHSQFSIGGEEAFEKWYLSRENNINSGWHRDTLRKIFMAAYSGEGIRVKEVKGKDLKEGDEYTLPFTKHVKRDSKIDISESTFLVRIPAPPKDK